jgi:hypothetical protein
MLRPRYDTVVTQNVSSHVSEVCKMSRDFGSDQKLTFSEAQRT